MPHTFESLGFLPAEILLPAPRVDLSRFAVIACDQYTSDPAYWQRVERMAENVPSALHIIFPEAYLNEGLHRVEKIHATMKRYLSEETLQPAVPDGFVLLERVTSAGARLGLLGRIDLEQYDFSAGSASLIRATEGTILERIPPRVRIRTGAPLETPHVMLLIDDPGRTVIEPLFHRRGALNALYDFELMEGGGRLRGWRVDAASDKAQLADALHALRAHCGGLLYAVGDGNHSLAAARQCWLNLRDTLPPAQRACHPARYALVELVNLHDGALRFHPIHRALFHVDAPSLLAAFESFLSCRGASLLRGEALPGEQPLVFVCPRGRFPLRIAGSPFALPVATLHHFLDAYLPAHPDTALDYIHGDQAASALGSQPGNAAFLLPALDKHALFPAVRRDGALVRKSFSMGEANEKRYYLECRRIVPN